MPEKFLTSTMENPKAEVLPEKKKKQKRSFVSLENEHVVKLREREQELPKDVKLILDKIARRRTISEEEKNRLKKVYEWLQQKRQKYKIPSPKELEEKIEELKEQESLGLPKDFFEILKTGDVSKIRLLRREMIAKNPEDIEKIEAIFWLFNLVAGAPKGMKKQEYRKEIFKLTEREFLLTQFIYANKENVGLLKEFWETGKKMMDTYKGFGGFSAWKSGLLSQVAAWHLLRKIGKKPQLSIPEEDEWFSIDLWGGKEMAVQVKTGKATHIQRINKIAYPALSYRDGDTEKFVETKAQTKERFVVDIEKYKQITGRNFEGYWLKIGKKERDDITGELTEEAVERIREELEQLEK